MPSATPRGTPKQWLVAILIWAFLGTWIYFFSFSLYASGCHKFSRSAAERLQKCENSLRFTGFLYTDYQRSRNLRMQGSTLAELGQVQEAHQTFDESIQILMRSYSEAPDVTLHILREPIREMNDPKVPPKAKELWEQVLLSHLER